jgi:hypothetical protein
MQHLLGWGFLPRRPTAAAMNRKRRRLLRQRLQSDTLCLEFSDQIAARGIA